MTDKFLETDHLISLDDAVKVINSEIQWCYQHPEQVTPEYLETFVKGLEQARNIIIEMARVRAVK